MVVLFSVTVQFSSNNKDDGAQDGHAFLSFYSKLDTSSCPCEDGTLALFSGGFRDFIKWYENTLKKKEKN